MNIVIFTHPDFVDALSISKYTGMLADDLRKQHHQVEIWTAKNCFSKIPSPRFVKKWLGYIDQFLLFPLTIQGKIKNCSPDTLFVIADQALGPWIPLIADRPHVIHCHDFMAQRSAFDEIPENKLGTTGKIYQSYIRRGYKKGKNFISISKKTQLDLHRFLDGSPQFSEVVYNGLNQGFAPGNREAIRTILESELKISLTEGYILHVGGNQFYKNKKGVIKIYLHWRKTKKIQIPLLLVGAPPNLEVKKLTTESDFSEDIHFLTNISDHMLRTIYQGAGVLLFPSLDEGFGWPIAEAMASGCPVITTNQPPMNEVGGKSCFYIPPNPNESCENQWIKESATVLDQVLKLSEKERREVIAMGILNAQRFNTRKTMKRIASIYENTLKMSETNSLQPLHNTTNIKHHSI